MKIVDAEGTLVISELSKNEKEKILAAIKSTPKKQPRTLTRKEAAEALRVHPDTIRRYGHTGKLSPIRISPQVVRYSEEQVLNLLSAGAHA